VEGYEAREFNRKWIRGPRPTDEPLLLKMFSLGQLVDRLLKSTF
jgi:hypothetical protein